MKKEFKDKKSMFNFIRENNIDKYEYYPNYKTMGYTLFY